MKNLLGKLFCRVFVTVGVMACACHILVAQLDDTFPTRKVSDFTTDKHGYCWYNNLKLDQIRQGIPQDKILIIIARLGREERSNSLNKRRLNNVRAYLTEDVEGQFRRSSDSIIIAEGERTSDRGHVEFYLDGRLLELLIPYLGRDLSVADCYAGIDGDPWCKTSRQKLFYPCKDYAKKKNSKTNIIKKK